MSLENYLNQKEQIYFLWNLSEGEKTQRTNLLVNTTKRIFHLQTFKGRTRIYRDIPISKIEYIENFWKDRKLGNNIT